MFLYFQISCSSFSVYAYLPIDYNLVFSHSKIFFFFQSNCELGLKPSFSIHISVSFCLFFICVASCRIWILGSSLPLPVNLVFEVLACKSWFAMNATQTRVFANTKQTEFNYVFEVLKGLFFAFLLKRKDALGSRLQSHDSLFYNYF